MSTTCSLDDLCLFLHKEIHREEGTDEGVGSEMHIFKKVMDEGPPGICLNPDGGDLLSSQLLKSSIARGPVAGRPTRDSQCRG